MARRARPSSAIALTALAALAAATLPACRLIDQRTFERRGTAPSAVQVAEAAAAVPQPAPPLAVIRFGGNDADWEGPLLVAARAARTRKATVQFDLVAPIPLSAGATVQAQAIEQGAADGARVARVLQADGFAIETIQLGQRGDAGNPPRQIEVYVR